MTDWRSKIKNITKSSKNKPLVLQRVPVMSNVVLPSLFVVQGVVLATQPPETLFVPITSGLVILSAGSLGMTLKYKPKKHTWSVAIHTFNIILYSILTWRGVIHQASDAAINASRP